MKKILLGTTAIVAAGMIVSPAVAAEKIKLGLGGYMEQWVGFADAESETWQDPRAIDTKSDTEIYFSGSTTLDNGVKFSAKVEMEADGDDANGSIDESWMGISGSFGEFQIGSNDAVNGAMHNSAVNFGPGFGDIDEWVDDAVVAGTNIQKSNDSYTTAGMGDENKIAYYSPRFGGLQVGMAYAPEVIGAGNQNQPNKDAGDTDAWSLGVNYKGEFSGASIGADLSYARQNDDTTTTSAKELTGWTAGLKVGYQGFSVGAGYMKEKRDMVAGQDDERTVWDIGAGYASGPWGVSISYLVSEDDGDNLADNEEDKWKIFALSGKYNLGPGIDVKGSIYNTSYEDEADVDANYVDGGWALVGGVKLSF